MVYSVEKFEKSSKQSQILRHTRAFTRASACNCVALNLMDYDATETFFNDLAIGPDLIINCAAERRPDEVER